VRHQVDYLVLGAGIAGLSFAVQAARHGSVALLAKRSRSESNTAYAQGGIAAVFGPQDSFDQHIQDTLIAGAGLCREEAVRVTVTEGPARVRELIELGAEFTRDATPLGYHLTREGGHSQRRVVHAADLTGLEVEKTLLEAAARGEGGILRNKAGEAFMERYDPRRELAPRDVVARSIDSELKRRGDDSVFLDMTHLAKGFLLEHFPHIYATCQAFGIDMAVTPIPVVPAAHYVCGGVCTDLRGQTTLPGLLAIGEVACTGLHGANRLASNSLLEGLVFGHRAAQTAQQIAAQGTLPQVPDWDPGRAVPADEGVIVKQNWD